MQACTHYPPGCNPGSASYSVRRWYDNRGQLRHGGNRISRHYYDLYQLIQSPIGQQTKMDFTLARDCARHARMFFNSKDLDLLHANPGSFSILPTSQMLVELKRDYEAMTIMIFGEVPNFTDIMKAIHELEETINSI